MPIATEHTKIRDLETTRSVHCGDALEWLRANRGQAGYSTVASLPDKSEFPSLNVDEWKRWFGAAAGAVLDLCDPDGIAIFYQSDITVAGEWIDKAYLCQAAAAAAGATLLSHKIVCRAPAGTLTFGRPSYSHLLAFSRRRRMDDVTRVTADVITAPGRPTWKRGMGLGTCREAADFIRQNSPTRTIVNPFCGEGAMLAAANAAGLNAIGIERNPKRAAKAAELRIAADGSRWI